MRFLVFEDDRSIAMLLSVLLKARGHCVQVFSNPLELNCLQDGEACSSQCPCADALITDLNMPGMNGLELLGSLNDKNCSISPLNCILISCRLSQEHIGLAANAGCHVLHKPFSIDAISHLIDSFSASAKSTEPQIA